MEDFQALFSSTMAVLKVEFTLMGFTFSMWDVFLWTFVAGILIWFVGGFFGD